MFLDNNIKCYDKREHEKSVEGKRGKAEFSLCFSSVLHMHHPAERSEEWIMKVCEMGVEGHRSRGRPWKTWQEVLSEDLRESQLTPGDAKDRKRWRHMTMRRQTRDQWNLT